MPAPSDDKAFAEQVRLRRIRKEQLEKVAETRAAIGRAGPWKESTSARIFKYVVWVLAALYLMRLLVNYILSPLVEADFSNEAIRQVVIASLFVVGMIVVVGGYYKTPVNHLSPARRTAVNCLLCLGGMVFIASYMLLEMAYYISSIFGICGAVFVLQFAKKFAKAN